MSIVMSPKSVRLNVREVTYDTLYDATYCAVSVDVDWAMWGFVSDAVWMTAGSAVEPAMSRAMRDEVIQVNEALHSNLNRFIEDVEQKWSAA